MHFGGVKIDAYFKRALLQTAGRNSLLIQLAVVKIYPTTKQNEYPHRLSVPKFLVRTVKMIQYKSNKNTTHHI